MTSKYKETSGSFTTNPGDKLQFDISAGFHSHFTPEQQRAFDPSHDWQNFTQDFVIPDGYVIVGFRGQAVFLADRRRSMPPEFELEKHFPKMAFNFLPAHKNGSSLADAVVDWGYVTNDHFTNLTNQNRTWAGNNVADSHSWAHGMCSNPNASDWRMFTGGHPGKHAMNDVQCWDCWDHLQSIGYTPATLEKWWKDRGMKTINAGDIVHDYNKVDKYIFNMTSDLTYCSTLLEVINEKALFSEYVGYRIDSLWIAKISEFPVSRNDYEEFPLPKWEPNFPYAVREFNEVFEEGFYVTGFRMKIMEMSLFMPTFSYSFIATHWQDPLRQRAIRLGWWDPSVKTTGQNIGEHMALKGLRIQYSHWGGYPFMEVQKIRMRDIRGMFPVMDPVDCKVSQWSGWSQCSPSGEQYRTRRIQQMFKYGGKGCPPTREFRDCEFGEPEQTLPSEDIDELLMSSEEYQNLKEIAKEKTAKLAEYSTEAERIIAEEEELLKLVDEYIKQKADQQTTDSGFKLNQEKIEIAKTKIDEFSKYLEKNPMLVILIIIVIAMTMIDFQKIFQPVVGGDAGKNSTVQITGLNTSSRPLS